MCNAITPSLSLSGQSIHSLNKGAELILGNLSYKVWISNIPGTQSFIHPRVHRGICRALIAPGNTQFYYCIFMKSIICLLTWTWSDGIWSSGMRQSLSLELNVRGISNIERWQREMDRRDRVACETTLNQQESKPVFLPNMPVTT